MPQQVGESSLEVVAMEVTKLHYFVFSCSRRFVWELVKDEFGNQCGQSLIIIFNLSWQHSLAGMI